MALPDADCDGQEKPSEFEACPNINACEEVSEPTSENPIVLSNDLSDYRHGIDELNQNNYQKQKVEKKLPSKKKFSKKQKRRRKKDKMKKVAAGDVEELNVVFKKGSNFKPFKPHTLSQMRYSSHVGVGR